MKFSQRICSMQASPIRKLAPYAAEAKEKGKKIYFLNIGQPDIKTPQAFFDAVGNFKNEVLAYGSSEGDTRLIDAICNYYKDYGVEQTALVTLFLLKIPAPQKFVKNDAQ
jgi:aspartate aminotransferase